jgi:multicomponent Na+:H+ antiporter subunit F
MTDTVLLVILGLMSFSMFLSSIRLVKGPTLADRVVALDLLAITGIALMSTAAILYDLESLLDVAILIGLVGFIGTAAFAMYIEKERS